MRWARHMACRVDKNSQRGLMGKSAKKIAF
jgi:hypothetical protein